MGLKLFRIFACVCVALLACVNQNEQQLGKSGVQDSSKQKISDSLKNAETLVVDTSIQNFKIKVVYHWSKEALFINVNDMIFDTSFYYVPAAWNLKTPFFSFQDSTKSNIYIKNNFLCLALPYNHVNPQTVFVYHIDNINKCLEICKDLKCSGFVKVNESASELTTYTNADPVNGLVKREKTSFKIGQCFSNRL